MADSTDKDATTQKKYQELQRRNAEALLGGGEKRIEQQHAKGKLTARERVALLLDEGEALLEVGLLVAYDQYDGQAPAGHGGLLIATEGVARGAGARAGRVAARGDDEPEAHPHEDQCDGDARPGPSRPGCGRARRRW